MPRRSSLRPNGRSFRNLAASASPSRRSNTLRQGRKRLSLPPGRTGGRLPERAAHEDRRSLCIFVPIRPDDAVVATVACDVEEDGIAFRIVEAVLDLLVAELLR